MHHAMPRAASTGRASSTSHATHPGAVRCAATSFWATTCRPPAWRRKTSRRRCPTSPASRCCSTATTSSPSCRASCRRCSSPRTARRTRSPCPGETLSLGKHTTRHNGDKTMRVHKFTAALALGLAVLAPALLVPAHAADEIVIGASLPLSGPLAGFGNYQKWGYETAVNDVNKDGGLNVGGKKMMVKLVIRDDKTDPSVVASNTETLLSRDGAVAMLGSCTPALVNAGALVAERRKVPLVAGCDPLGAFKSVRAWKYAWVMFFDEGDLSTAPFRMMAEMGLQTNKKVAILHDNGPDGQVVGGSIWPNAAKSGGYSVVQNASFPVDTQQFTTRIAEAKGTGGDGVLVEAMP